MMKLSKLSEEQWLVLKALADRVIPADDYPNAWGAGVGSYLERLFALMPQFVPLYQTGLDSLDLEAIATTGRGFCDLTEPEQDLLLTRVEAGQIENNWTADPKAFFNLAVDQVMEGYYADPGNGGNKDAVSWRMIGFRVTL